MLKRNSTKLIGSMSDGRKDMNGSRNKKKEECKVTNMNWINLLDSSKITRNSLMFKS